MDQQPSDVLEQVATRRSSRELDPETPPDAGVDPTADSESGSGSRSGSRSSGRRRTRRTDWRLGGRTVRKWREMTLAWAFLSLGIGVFGGFAIAQFWRSPWASLAATALLWASMLVPTIIAFSRSRPIGLLRFRPLDLLYGLVLGVVLRFFQGWISTVSGVGADFPSFTLIDGKLPALWWLTDAASAGVIAPVIEEFFFRGLLLVTLYTLLRRPSGKLAAGVAAGLISTAVFIIVHSVSGVVTTDAVVSIGMLGAVCALLVLLTGRIWSAVLVHIVFNTTYLLLGLVGTFVG